MEQEQPKSLQAELLENGSLIGGRYRIKRTIGFGGMGAVYAAEDEAEKGVVALKVLHRQFLSDRSYIERFLREARIMQRIDHPSVVRTSDFGTDGDVVYMVMDFVNGESLEKYTETHRLDERSIAKLIREACAGLDAVHSIGVVHRDLKPGNLLITADGQVKIADFGAAREEFSKLTKKLQKVGSMCFMAPEVWLGEKIAPPTDYYSLGIVLYELVTAELPFNHDFPGGLMELHLERAPKPPHEIDPEIPAWLDALILRLLHKNPKQRPSSLVDLGPLIPRAFEGNTEEGWRSPLRPASLHDVPAEIPAEGYVPGGLPEAGDAKARARTTYVFSLTATQVFEDVNVPRPATRRKRKATVSIPLPRHAAVVFEIEPPSRDFIALAIFLASLQAFDGYLTAHGIATFGTQAEGNPIIRRMFDYYGVADALFIIKSMAIVIVAGITCAAKRLRWVRDMIALLSCVYLFFAILPWLYILYIRGPLETLL